MSETIKDYCGRIIGTIETDGRGNKTVKDYCGRILGTYDSSSNYTKDYCGRILYQGDMASALLIR